MLQCRSVRLGAVCGLQERLGRQRQVGKCFKMADGKQKLSAGACEGRTKSGRESFANRRGHHRGASQEVQPKKQEL